VSRKKKIFFILLPNDGRERWGKKQYRSSGATTKMKLTGVSREIAACGGGDFAYRGCEGRGRAGKRKKKKQERRYSRASTLIVADEVLSAEKKTTKELIFTCPDGRSINRKK